MSTPCRVEWVILTRGDRPDELGAAVDSLGDSRVTIVWNGTPAQPSPSLARANVVESPTNLGVPGGRDLGMRSTVAPLVGFLDDDAVLAAGAHHVANAFDDPLVAVVGCRLVDETGATSRRHVPRIGDDGASRGGDVATFLGGASMIRREAYDSVGGYWTDLFYGHEELDLAWRLTDAGWRIRYEPRALVVHPHTEISRHPDGWRLTGRNRVMIARRNLPWPVAVVHVTLWLAAGISRAPTAAARRSYASGWWSGWHQTVVRRSIAWSTVATLARRGRFPIV